MEYFSHKKDYYKISDSFDIHFGADIGARGMKEMWNVLKIFWNYTEINSSSQVDSSSEKNSFDNFLDISQKIEDIYRINISNKDDLKFEYKDYEDSLSPIEEKRKGVDTETMNKYILELMQLVYRKDQKKLKLCAGQIYRTILTSKH